MLFYLFASLCGYYRFKTDSPLRVANLLTHGAISVFGLTVREGKAFFYCFLSRKKKTLAALREYRITVEESTLCGLPAILYRHRFRFGAMLGLVVAILLPYLSSRFIWQIEVVGNERVSDSEVLSLLAKEGVVEGAYIGGIDPLAVANRCVMASDEIAWMGVNIIGNCVEVNLAEYTEKDIPQKDNEPSNVVAKKSGVVKQVILSSGVATVGEGSVVSEGALLISGVNQLRNGSYHYQPAKGQVFAETLGEITVRKPLKTYEKVYTGEIFEEKGYIFFTKVKKFTQDTRYLPASYGRIERKERVMLFGAIPLPIWIIRVEYRPFTMEEVSLSEEEATALALADAYRQIEGELVSAEERVFLENGVVTVMLRYRAVEDIAKDLPLFDTP